MNSLNNFNPPELEEYQPVQQTRQELYDEANKCLNGVNWKTVIDGTYLKAQVTHLEATILNFKGDAQHYLDRDIYNACIDLYLCYADKVFHNLYTKKYSI